MSKITLKGANLLAPLPVVMVTVGDMVQSNIITVAWTGIVCSVPPRVYISVREDRYSHALLDKTGEFVINFTTESLLAACDWCGVRSGRDHDKFAEMKLNKGKAQKVSVPLIEESPINIECRVFDKLSLGSHTMFLADVLAVDVDESVVDGDGAIDYAKCRLVDYMHGEYYAQGRHLGRFGFAAQKKYIARYGKGKDAMSSSSLTRRKRSAGRTGNISDGVKK